MRPPPNDELTSKTNRNHLLYRANTVYFEVLVFVDHLEGADKSVGILDCKPIGTSRDGDN